MLFSIADLSYVPAALKILTFGTERSQVQILSSRFMLK